MIRNSVQTVTSMPVLVLADSAREADGWGTFLNADEVWDEGMFVRIATGEDVKKWLKTEFSQEDLALFIGASRLKRAYDKREEFALSQAHKILQPFVKNLASIEDSVIELKLKDGAKISLRSSPRWNATRWNFSGLLRDVFDDAKFVIWHSEKEDRFIPALYCSNRKTAAFIVQFMGRIRVCPKCDAPFIPLAGNVDYCSPAHREAHRVARSRWRAKQKTEGKKKK
jgi:hypothetical protein